MPAAKVPFSGFLTNTATAVYEFVGSRGAFARLKFLSFCNTDLSARTVTLAVVPAGETITGADWRLLDAVSLATKESLWLMDEDDGGIILKSGDRVVMFASASAVVAVRLCVEEEQQ